VATLSFPGHPLPSAVPAFSSMPCYELMYPSSQSLTNFDSFHGALTENHGRKFNKNNNKTMCYTITLFGIHIALQKNAT
jgi:hypothetical protein